MSARLGSWRLIGFGVRQSRQEFNSCFSCSESVSLNLECVRASRGAHLLPGELLQTGDIGDKAQPFQISAWLPFASCRGSPRSPSLSPAQLWELGEAPPAAFAPGAGVLTSFPSGPPSASDQHLPGRGPEFSGRQDRGLRAAASRLLSWLSWALPPLI